ncbi:uncharacterized protein LOC106641339 [Copidosoma floridanum]|uniref:uncharacterized protein LOC106641339 n=1 Tax=Copidosoma floridanum TaxID=29053 RepID=UPI0006C94D42|nr:uncharacterized protein LOC106641339 [Copidosoma floridanum]
MERKFYIVQVTNFSDLKRPFIVPGTFMLKDKTGAHYVCYMAPPYSKDSAETLREIVRNYSSPASSWPIYRCQVLNTKATYDEALLELDKIKSEDVDNVHYIENTKVRRKRLATGFLKHDTSNIDETESQSMYDMLSIPELPISATNKNQEREYSYNKQGDNRIKKVKIYKEISIQTESSETPNCPLTKEVLEEVLKKNFEELKNYIDRKISREMEILYLKIKDKMLNIEKRPILNTTNFITFDSFSNKYSQHEFPLKTVNEYDDFSKDLENDESSFKSDLKQYFLSTINFTLDVTDNLKIILKKLLSKDVLKDFTPQVQKSGKSVFKETKLYCLLEESLIEIYNENLTKDKHINQKIILKSIGTIFNNAKDWDGGRAARGKKDKEKSSQELLLNVTE